VADVRPISSTGPSTCWKIAYGGRGDTTRSCLTRGDHPSPLVGLTRYIGVSNYSPAQIDLLVRTGGEAPVLNQIPFGPNDWDADLVVAHVERGVVVEGYSGFKRTDLRARALVAAGQAHGVTVAQVVVRWHVQHDVVVIPKSKTSDRIAANIDVDGFALTADEMAAIDALGT
jgi:2,5-diketo-D-gluconate reductase A